jgi:hypothetical protein
MSTFNHDLEHAAPSVLDRRVFVGTFAAASAVSLLPLPTGIAASLQAGPAATLLADWHIDDQWGPRYTL